MAVESQYRDQVTFVGMPGLAGVPEMQGFVSETNTGGIVHVPDAGNQLWRRFGVFEQRTYIFINDDGTYRMGGYGSLEADVRELIAR